MQSPRYQGRQPECDSDGDAGPSSVDGMRSDPGVCGTERLKKLFEHKLRVRVGQGNVHSRCPAKAVGGVCMT
jgi:hypothetical protein